MTTPIALLPIVGGALPSGVVVRSDSASWPSWVRARYLAWSPRPVWRPRSPSRAAGARNHMPEAFRTLLRSARREVLIVNAYIIPDAGLVDDLREALEQGRSGANGDAVWSALGIERWNVVAFGSGGRLVPELMRIDGLPLRHARQLVGRTEHGLLFAHHGLRILVERDPASAIGRSGGSCRCCKTSATEVARVNEAIRVRCAAMRGATLNVTSPTPKARPRPLPPIQPRKKPTSATNTTRKKADPP